MAFDDVITRRGTGSIKWDSSPELDPFWIADMDFTSPPGVIKALQERVSHGVFGYPIPHHGLTEILLHYLASRHHYQATLENIVHLGGLVPALSLAARAFGKPGDDVLTCTPVYPPFVHVGRDGNLTTLEVKHIQIDGNWTFDWEGLAKAATSKTKLFYLCSPQNPLGRCFTKVEITKISQFCLDHKMILISDEVHCDLVLDEAETPFFSVLNLPENHRRNSVVLHYPSKTYNVAGLGYAFAVIEDPKIRSRFTASKGHALPEINCLSYFAAEAAYRHGESWRQDC